MKEEDMLRAMSQIDPDFVMEADYIEQNKKRDPLPWKKYIGIAACICFLLVGGYVGLMDLAENGATTMDSTSNSNGAGDGTNGYGEEEGTIEKVQVSMLYVDGKLYELANMTLVDIDLSYMTFLGTVEPYMDHPELTTTGIYADTDMEGARVYSDGELLYLEVDNGYLCFITSQS